MQQCHTEHAAAAAAAAAGAALLDVGFPFDPCLVLFLLTNVL